jgi:hypothetical protein
VIMEDRVHSEESVRAFAGGNAEHYVGCFRQFSEAPHRKLRFNLAAFLGQPVWLAYRKLYGALAGLLIGYLAYASLFLYLSWQEPLAPVGVATFNLVGVILFFALPGYLGNYLYWRKYQRVLRKADDGERDPAGRLTAIRGSGGTSPLGAWLVVALFASPVLWAGFQASRFVDTGYVFDATGPLTVEEVEANFLSSMDLGLSADRRACVLREVGERAKAAGDPETLEPGRIEMIPEENWQGIGVFGRRLMLTQAIATKALYACLERSP